MLICEQTRLRPSGSPPERFRVTIASGTPYTRSAAGARPATERNTTPESLDVRLKMLSLNDDEVKVRLIYRPAIKLFVVRMSLRRGRAGARAGRATTAPLPASTRPLAFACRKACAALRSSPPYARQRRDSSPDHKQSRPPGTRCSRRRSTRQSHPCG
jgi:hypothetical protein